MWTSIWSWCKAWISKPENQTKVKEAAEKAADLIKK